MTIPKFESLRLSLGALAAGAVLLLTGPLTPAFAASCPTVADPQGIKMAFPQQLELEDFEKQSGAKLSFSERPEFAAQVAAGTLPPVAGRLPAEPLVMLPNVDCGKYGGTLRGLARAYESGTSEILSWRRVNMVRYSDDFETVVPNVAKGWEWNDDYTEKRIHRCHDARYRPDAHRRGVSGGHEGIMADHPSQWAATRFYAQSQELAMVA